MPFYPPLFGPKAESVISRASIKYADTAAYNRYFPAAVQCFLFLYLRMSRLPAAVRHSFLSLAARHSFICRLCGAFFSYIYACRAYRRRCGTLFCHWPRGTPLSASSCMVLRYLTASVFRMSRLPSFCDARPLASKLPHLFAPDVLESGDYGGRRHLC